MIKRALRVLLPIILLFTLSSTANALDFNAESTYDSVFVIYSGDYLGSGFSIGENCIISNAHVIGSEREIIIKNYAGDTYKAGIIAIDYSLDIVVLTVPGASFPYLTMGDEAAMAIGDDVYTIGAPSDLEYTLTKGIISAKNRTIDGYSYIQIDAPINSGNSGGPLLSSKGEVIGVNTLKAEDAEGIGFSIPISTVEDYLSQQGIDYSSAEHKTTSPEADNQNTKEQTQENPQEEENNKNAKGEDGKLSQAYFVYGIIFVVAMSMLVILIIYRKNRTKKKKIIASERTDFDIDIYD